MFTISQLAESILLDDVTDVLYRHICFSSYVRSEFEPQSVIETELDQQLAIALAQQLTYSTPEHENDPHLNSITSVDPAIMFIVDLLQAISVHQLTHAKLKEFISNNEVFAKALKETGEKLSYEQPELVFLEQINQGFIAEFVVAVIMTYFQLLLSEYGQNALFIIEKLSRDIVNEMAKQKKAYDVCCSKEELHHISFINLLPMLLMIKLFEYTVNGIKSSKQSESHSEQQQAEINSYQPTAELFQAFLTFDEFVKPDVLEHIGIDDSVVSNFIIVKGQTTEPKNHLFLSVRNKMIVEHLKPHNILTLTQLVDYKTQKGIHVKIIDKPELGHVGERLWGNVVTEGKTK